MVGRRMATTDTTAQTHLVVMGVSGCGKSVLASLLAGRLDYRLCEADDFHPAANVDTMSRGIPLTDEDREPWLRSLAAWVKQQHSAGHSSVMACSALKRQYRDLLREGSGQDLVFVHLVGDQDTILERLSSREHFMPRSLLGSQLDTLEPLQADETGVQIELDQPREAVLSEALAWLSSRRR